MAVPLLHIDAFAERPFAGNPAAVCLLDRPRDAAWMQAVAEEMNLSETAFATATTVNQYDLRWFTPAVEVDLCGHATLASAHALWSTGRVPDAMPIRFQTRSGALMARRAAGSAEGATSPCEITIDLPARFVREAAPPDELVARLGVAVVWSGVVSKKANDADWLIECESEGAVRAATPDLAWLRTFPGGVILTARASSSHVDIVSRYFAAHYGVDEDPVTGSAHCALAPYWTRRLGRLTLKARQVSARGGALRVELNGERVFLSGHAVTVLRGELAD